MIWDLWTLVVAFVLPRSRAKNWLLSRRPGYEVSPAALIGHCFVVRVRTMQLQAGTEIGFGSVFWGLTRLELAENAFIGALNWISASPDFIGADPDPDVGVLVMGREALMTNRHRLDCSGGLYLGELVSLGGYGINVLTHSYSLYDRHQHTAPTRIGDHAFIATRALLLMGASLADGVVVAAGSVVSAPLDRERGFYAGSPARHKREMPVDLPYYQRTHRAGRAAYSSPVSSGDSPAGDDAL